MKNIFTFLFAALISGVTFSQEDMAAVKVLDQFSALAKGASSVSIDFRILTNDIMENRKDTVDGKVVLLGDRYKLTLPESTVWFNGTDSWNYIPSVNEVTISRPEADGSSFFSKPSLLYTMYKEGYKPRLVEENASEYIIDLYPDDIKMDLVRIRLVISKPGLSLKIADYKTKNGVTMTMMVNEYSLKYKPEANFFVFDPSKYKGIEVIDMR